jgi:hypothetical protein
MSFYLYSFFLSWILLRDIYVKEFIIKCEKLSLPFLLFYPFVFLPDGSYVGLCSK